MNLSETCDETSECAICGLLLNEKYTYKLKECNHVFHYECLMKTFETNYSNKNRCPYCRKKCEYLPLVNGLKKIIPGIHCELKKISEKEKNDFKLKYANKCKYVFKKGKNKDKPCGCKCKLGYEYCGKHIKSK